jgi:hypothetical protein
VKGSPVANGILDIDHLMCGVESTDDARRSFERLGFSLTPDSNIESLGLANALVCLRPANPGVANFIEFMAIEDPEGANPTMRSLLAGRPGIKSIVNAVEDADEARRLHAEAGFEVLPVWPVERFWELPSGEALQLRFRVFLPKLGQAPFMFNGVQYLTLEHYLREEFLDHPNGAVRWRTVTAVADEGLFGETVRVYERLYGSAARHDGGGEGVAIVPARDVALRVVTTEALARLYPDVDLEAVEPPAAVGFTVVVEDLGRLNRTLDENSVSSNRVGDSIVVGPADACGNVVEFTWVR